MEPTFSDYVTLIYNRFEAFVQSSDEVTKRGKAFTYQNQSLIDCVFYVDAVQEDLSIQDTVGMAEKTSRSLNDDGMGVCSRPKYLVEWQYPNLVEWKFVSKTAFHTHVD